MMQNLRKLFPCSLACSLVFVLVAVGLSLAEQAYAQTNSPYKFKATSGTFTSIRDNSEATRVHLQGLENDGMGGMRPISSGDDGSFNPIHIGFEFNLFGEPIHTLVPTSNLSLSTDPGFLCNGADCYQPTLNNDAIFTAGIYPFWSDGAATQISRVHYLRSGEVGERELTIEFSQFRIIDNLSDQDDISLQVKLFENDNRIQFVYQRGVENSPEASSMVAVGLAASSDFLSGSNTNRYYSLNNYGTGPTALSSNSDFTTITERGTPRPESGQTFTFTPNLYLPVVADIVTLATVNISVVLPEALHVTGVTTYTLTDPPAGFSWDAETRTLSGNSAFPLDPAVALTYSVTDNFNTANDSSDDVTESRTFNLSAFPKVGEGLATFFAANISPIRVDVNELIEPVTLPEPALGDPPYAYSITPELPLGVSFIHRNRVLTGVPTVAMATKTFTYTATDIDGQSASLTFTITVQADTVPMAPSEAQVFKFYPGQVVSETLKEFTKGNGDLTYALVETPALPAGLTFTAATRVIAGTLAADMASVDDSIAVKTYTYSATDTDDETAMTTFTIEVVDSMPVAPSSVPDLTFTGGANATPFVLPPFTTTADPSPALTYSLSPASPGGLSFDTGTRKISGMPNALSAGTTSSPTTVTYAATDGTDTASTMFNITIVSAAVPQFAGTIPDIEVFVGMELNYEFPNVGVSNIDDFSRGVTYEIAENLPTGLAYDGQLGRLMGTITGTNMDDSDRMTYTYTVTGGDNATRTPFDLVIIDPKPDVNFRTKERGQQPVLEGDVVLAVGEETRIDSSIAAQVTVANNGMMDTRETNDDGEFTGEGEAANGPHTISINPAPSTLPTGLMFEDTSFGDFRQSTLHGTPMAIFGPMDYTITVTDSDGDAVTRTFFLEVVADFNPVAPAESQDFVFDVGATVNEQLAPFTGGNGELRYDESIVPALPTGLSYDRNTRRITGRIPDTAVDQNTSPATYTYTVSDTRNNEASATFTIAIVDLVPVAPTVPNLSIKQNVAIPDTTIPRFTTTTALNPDLTYSLTGFGTDSLPAGLTYDPVTSVLSGTPTGIAADGTDETGFNPLEYTATIGPDTVSTLFSIDIVRNLTPMASADVPGGGYMFAVGDMVSETLPAFTGGDGTLNISLTDGDGDAIDSTNTLPGGLTYTPPTSTTAGTITGTVVGTANDDSVPMMENDPAPTFTYTATDADMDTAPITFTITIDDAIPLFTGPIEPIEVLQGDAITAVTLEEVSTPGTGEIIYSINSGLPDGVMFDAETRILSGAPSPTAEARAYTYVYRATDADGDITTLQGRITVAEDSMPSFFDPDGPPPAPGEQFTENYVYLPGQAVMIDIPEIFGGNGVLMTSIGRSMSYDGTNNGRAELTNNHNAGTVRGTIASDRANIDDSIPEEAADFDVRDGDEDKAIGTYTIEVVDFLPQAVNVPDYTFIAGMNYPETGEGVVTLPKFPAVPYTAGSPMPDEPAEFSYTIDIKNSPNSPQSTLVGDLMFNAETRTLFGTPNTSGAAMGTYVYRATDGAESDDDEFTVTIVSEAQLQAPVVPYFVFSEGQTVSEELPVFTGVSGLTYSVAEEDGTVITSTDPLAFPLTSGLTFNPSTRTISGTVDLMGDPANPANDSVAETYRYIATASGGDPAHTTFSISIDDAMPEFAFENDLPSLNFLVVQDPGDIVRPALSEAEPGTGSTAYTLTQSDMTALPANALVFNPDTRVLTIRATATLPETELIYTATDADGDSDSRTITITVAEDTVPMYAMASQSVQVVAGEQGFRVVTNNVPSESMSTLRFPVLEQVNWGNVNEIEGFSQPSYVVSPHPTPNPCGTLSTGIECIYRLGLRLRNQVNGGGELFGAIEDTPADDSLTQESITVTATDFDGSTDTFTYNFIVTDHRPEAPEPDSIGPYTFEYTTQQELVGFFPRFVKITPIQLPPFGHDTVPTPTMTYSATGLPNGLTLSSTGLLEGRPTESEIGAHTVTYIANDTVDIAETTFVINIVDEIPQFDIGTPILDLTFTTGSNLVAETLTAATGGTGTITYSISPRLPAGIEFDPISRVLSGTPTEVHPKSTFTYTATDEVGESVSEDFTLEVIQNLIPSYPPNSDQTFILTPGDQVLLSLPTPLSTGNGGNFMNNPGRDTWRMNSSWSWLNLINRLPGAPSTAEPVFSGTVPADTTDDDSLVDLYSPMEPTRLTVTRTISERGGESDSFTYTFLVVDVVPLEPRRTISNYEISSGESFQSILLPEFTTNIEQPDFRSKIGNRPVPDSELTYSLTLDGGAALPSWLSFDPATLILSSPPLTMAPSADTINLIYEATHGMDVAMVSFNIVVVDDARPIAPEIPNGGLILALGQSFNQILPEFTISDSSALTYTFTAADGSAPPDWLSFDSTTRRLSGTVPALDTAEDESSTTVYFYSATETDGDRVDAIFTIEIVDNLPTFGGFEVRNFSARQNVSMAAVTLPVATGGTGTLTYSITPSLPAGIQFNASERTLFGTPRDYFLESTYTYTVTDSVGDTQSLSFTIEVNQNQTPSFGRLSQNKTFNLTPGEVLISTRAIFPTPTANGDGTPMFTITPERDSDTGAFPAPWNHLRLAIDGNTAGRQFGNTPPRADTEGDESLEPLVVTRTITDEDGDSASVSFTFRMVDPQPIPPAIPDYTFQMGQAIDPIVLPQFASTADDYPAVTSVDEGVSIPSLTYTLTGMDGAALPAGLEFAESTRTLSGTPTTPTPTDGSVVNYRATGGGDSAGVNFNIVVVDTSTPVAPAIPNGGFVFTPGQLVAETLPVFTGGTGELTYSLMADGSPATTLIGGLTFNPTDRTISGTLASDTSADESVPSVTYTYIATDSATPTANMGQTTFTIEIVDARPEFGQGATIANITVRENSTLGRILLPTATGGRGILNYGFTTALPAGLNLDLATESFGNNNVLFPWLIGTPTTSQNATTYTYTVTDEDGDTATIEFDITVTEDRLIRYAADADRTFILTPGDEDLSVELPTPDLGDGVRPGTSVTLPTDRSAFPSWWNCVDPCTGFRYTVPGDEEGDDSVPPFSVTRHLTDIDGDTASVTFTFLVVDSLPTVPTTRIPNYRLALNQQIQNLVLPEFRTTADEYPTVTSPTLTYTLAILNEDGTTTAFTSGNAMDGISFTAGTRTISGTPPTAADPVTFVYEASDGADKASVRFTIEVIDSAPTVPKTPIPSMGYSVAVNQEILNLVLPEFATTANDLVHSESAGSLTYTLTIRNSDSTTSTFTPGNAIKGISFNATTRTISGTPTTAEPIALTYTASDGVDMASVDFNLNVVGDSRPEAPTFADGGFTFAVETAFEDVTLDPFTIPDGTGMIMTYRLTDAAGMDISDANRIFATQVGGTTYGLSFDPATRTISGTLLDDEFGNADLATLTYSATDNDSSDPETVSTTFTITLTDAMPTFGSQTIPDYTGAQGRLWAQGELPAASEGTMPYTYGVAVSANAPILTGEIFPGLSFDGVSTSPTFRHLVGTPSSAFQNNIVRTLFYVVTDTNRDSVRLPFKVLVTENRNPRFRRTADPKTSTHILRPGEDISNAVFQRVHYGDDENGGYSAMRDVLNPMPVNDSFSAPWNWLTLTMGYHNNDPQEQDRNIIYTFSGTAPAEMDVDDTIRDSAGDVESFTVRRTYTDNDGDAFTVTRIFRVVDPFPIAPQIPNYEFSINEAINPIELPIFTTVADDFPSITPPTLTYTLEENLSGGTQTSDLPDWLTPMLPTGTTPGTLTGTPMTGDIGTHNFVYTAADGVDMASVEFTIEVVNDPRPVVPTIPNDGYTFNIGTDATQDLPPFTIFDGTDLMYALEALDADGNALTEFPEDIRDILAFDTTTRVITFTTPADMAGDGSIDVEFKYTATDSDTTDPDSEFTTFTITVVDELPEFDGIRSNFSGPATRPIEPRTLPSATGGRPPYTYSLTQGSLSRGALDLGLSLDTTPGSPTFLQLSGTLPALPGVSSRHFDTYTYRVTDADGDTGLQTFQVTIIRNLVPAYSTLNNENLNVLLFPGDIIGPDGDVSDETLSFSTLLVSNGNGLHADTPITITPAPDAFPQAWSWLMIGSEDNYRHFTGTVPSTPTDDSLAPFKVTRTVTDVDGDTASTSFTLELVDAIPVAPAADMLDYEFVANRQIQPIVLPAFTTTVDDNVDVRAPDLTYDLVALAVDNSPLPLPGWLRWDAETRTLTGMPRGIDAGMTRLRYSATDEADSAQVTFTIDVEGNASPVAPTVAQNFSFRPGQTFDETADGVLLPFTGGNGDLTYTLDSASSLPAGVNFRGDPLSLYGTIGADTAADDSVERAEYTYIATDIDGNSASATFTVAIIDTMPMAPIVGNRGFLRDTAIPDGYTLPEFTTQLDANPEIDLEAPPLTYSLTARGGGALPDWLMFDDDPESETFRQISSMSTSAGHHNVTYSATDGADSASEDFAIIVTSDPMPIEPSFPDGFLTVSPGVYTAEMAALTLPEFTGGNKPLTHSLTDMDDAVISPTNRLFVDATVANSGLTFNPTTRQLTGTIPGTSGNDMGREVVIYSAMDSDPPMTSNPDDGDGPDTTNTTLTITLVDNIPMKPVLPALESVMIEIGQPIMETLAAYTGGDGTLMYEIDSVVSPLPTWPDGSIMLMPNGELSGTALMGTSSDDARHIGKFLYSATDYDGDEGVPTLFNLSITDAAPDFGSSMIDSITLIQNSMLIFDRNLPVVNTPGSGDQMYTLTGANNTALPTGLTFIPNSGTEGDPPVLRALSGALRATLPETAFTYRVTDADGDTVSIDFNITVVADADLVAPDLSLTRAFTIKVGETVTGVTLPAFTGGNAPIRYAIAAPPATALPQGLTLHPETGQILGTIDDAAGDGSSANPVTYTYTATDAGGKELSATFTLAVEDEFPVAPTGAQNFYGIAGEELTLQLDAFTHTTAGLEYSLVTTGRGNPNLPNGLMFNSDLTVTGSIDDDGEDNSIVQQSTNSLPTFTYSASDGFDSTSASFTITIVDVRPIAPQDTGGLRRFSVNRPISASTILPEFGNNLPSNLPSNSGITPLPFTYTLTNTPSSWVLSIDNNRVLSGTPTELIPEEDPLVVTYTATEAIAGTSDPGPDSASATFTIAVVTDIIPDPPTLPLERRELVFTPGTMRAASGVETLEYPPFDGADGMLTYSVSDGTNPVNSLIGGLMFNPETRIIHGTVFGDAMDNSVPETTYTYTATDDDGTPDPTDDDPASVTFTITIVDESPDFSTESREMVENITVTRDESIMVTLPEVIKDPIVNTRSIGTGTITYSLSPAASTIPGVSFNAETRLLDVTPTSAAAATTTTFTYTATDRDGDVPTEEDGTTPNPITFTITVEDEIPLVAPAIANNTYEPGDEVSLILESFEGGNRSSPGAPLDYSLLVRDPDTGTDTVTTTLVGGLTFDPETRMITGPEGRVNADTPSDQNEIGTYTYRATDRDDDSLPTTFTITIFDLRPIRPPEEELNFGNVSHNTLIRPFTLPEFGDNRPEGSNFPKPTFTYTVVGLPTGLMFNNDPDDENYRQITGTPEELRNFPAINYTASEGDGRDFATVTFGIEVVDNNFPQEPDIDNFFFTPGPLPTVTLPVFTGGDGTLSYSLIDSDDNVIDNNTYSLIAGLQWNPASDMRTISGTATLPQGEESAMATYRYTATEILDEAGTTGDVRSVAFTITVEPDTTPAAPTPPTFTFTVGEDISLSASFDATALEFTGGNAPVTYSQPTPALPEGLAFDEESAALTGTPTGTDQTVASVTQIYNYTATDRDGDRASSTFTITLTDSLPVMPTTAIIDREFVPGDNLDIGGNIGVITLPVFTGGNRTASGAPLDYSLRDSDGEIDNTSNPLIAGLDYNATTREISGTIPADMSGVDSSIRPVTYTYTATDADGDERSVTFTLAVVDVVPVAPTLTAEIEFTMATTIAAGRVLPPFDDNIPDGSSITPTFTYRLIGNPEYPDWLDFDADPASLSFSGMVPPFTEIEESERKTSVTYEASDGTDTAMVSFVVSIVENSMPNVSAIEDNYTFNVGDPVSQELPASTGGDGVLMYTLAPASPPNSAAVTTLVAPLSDFTFTPATRIIAGSITGTDDNDSVNPISYIYTATDEDDESDPQTFTITINDEMPEFADGTMITNITGVVNTAITTVELPQVVLDSDSNEIGTGAITYSLIDSNDMAISSTNPLPGGLTFNPTTRELAGDDPTAGINETYTYTATDMDGDTDTIEFTITITDEMPAFATGATIPDIIETEGTAITPNPVPLLAVTTHGTGGADETTYSLVVRGADGEPDPLAEFPSLFTFDAPTRMLTFKRTPTAADVGTTRLRYIATDGNGDEATIDFTITINSLIDTTPTAPTTVPDLMFTAGQVITPVRLDPFTGGNGLLTYSLVDSDGNATTTLVGGLTFNPDRNDRQITGTVTDDADDNSESETYTYTATDIDRDSASVTFTITITDENSLLRPEIIGPNYTLRYSLNADIGTVPLPAFRRADSTTRYNLAFMAPSTELPPGLTFAQGATTRILMGEPSRAGEYQVTYTATTPGPTQGSILEMASVDFTIRIIDVPTLAEATASAIPTVGANIALVATQAISSRVELALDGLSSGIDIRTLDGPQLKLNPQQQNGGSRSSVRFGLWYSAASDSLSDTRSTVTWEGTTDSTNLGFDVGFDLSASTSLVVGILQNSSSTTANYRNTESANSNAGILTMDLDSTAFYVGLGYDWLDAWFANGSADSTLNDSVTDMAIPASFSYQTIGLTAAFEVADSLNLGAKVESLTSDLSLAEMENEGYAGLQTDSSQLRTAFVMNYQWELGAKGNGLLIPKFEFGFRDLSLGSSITNEATAVGGSAMETGFGLDYSQRAWGLTFGIDIRSISVENYSADSTQWQIRWESGDYSSGLSFQLTPNSVSETLGGIDSLYSGNYNQYQSLLERQRGGNNAAAESEGMNFEVGYGFVANYGTVTPYLKTTNYRGSGNQAEEFGIRYQTLSGLELTIKAERELTPQTIQILGFPLTFMEQENALTFTTRYNF